MTPSWVDRGISAEVCVTLTACCQTGLPMLQRYLAAWHFLRIGSDVGKDAPASGLLIVITTLPLPCLELRLS